SGALYDEETNGSLWRWQNLSWARLDGGVSRMQVAANGTLFDLESNGAFWSLQSSWAKIGDHVVSFALGRNGTVAYALTGGTVVVPGAGSVGPGVNFYGVDAAGDVWYLLNGTLDKDSTSGALLQVQSISNVALAALNSDGT